MFNYSLLLIIISEKILSQFIIQSRAENFHYYGVEVRAGVCIVNMAKLVQL